MRLIPPDAPLSVGDVLHQAAFGFATVLAVDPAGASLRWEAAGNLHPTWVSRAALRDAYHQCHPFGLLALTVRDLDQARRLLIADEVGAIGRLLVDIGPAGVGELKDWLATRRLVLREEFSAWWEPLAERIAADPRFRLENERFAAAADADFPDTTLPIPEPLAAQGSCPAADGLNLACELARSVCALHALGQTLRAPGAGKPRDAFSRLGSSFVASGQPGGEPSADVRAVAAIVLEQILGPLPTESRIPVAEILPSLGELAPELPLEFTGAIERALSADRGLRQPDAFSLLHDLERARAAHRIRETFPLQPDARIAVGFDSHIGMGRALHGQVNQDALLIAGDSDCALLVVADGISVSTAGSGDLASRLLIETLQKWWTEQAATVRSASPPRVHQAIREGLARANRQILTEAARLVEGRLSDHIPMGSTVTLAITQGNRVHLASLGDSRAWIAGSWGVSLLTSDQNLQSQLLREHVSGTDPDWTDERFPLTGYCGHLDATGRPALPPVYSRTFTLLPGEWVVMTTDGFSDYAHADSAGLARVLASAVRESERPPAALWAMAVAQGLVRAANDGGGGDNVTVLAFTLSAGTTSGSPIRERGTTAGASSPR